MLKLTGYLVLLFCAAPLAAEEWADINGSGSGFAGMGAAFGRDATGGHYNSTNTARRPWETGSFPKFEIDAHGAAPRAGEVGRGHRPPLGGGLPRR